MYTENNFLSGNEDGLHFEDAAFSLILDIRDVAIEDCIETIEDVKSIISEIAHHRMDKLNSKVKTGERSGYIDSQDMPGLNPEKIIVKHLSNAIIPTEIHCEGYTFVNTNFIKLMHLQATRGMKGESGKIPNIPDLAEYNLPMGELYSSIIYSMAIHIIDGYYDYHEDGKIVFNPERERAHLKRGNIKKHQYVNLLSMLYYWIVLVEKSPEPQKRASDFIMKNHFIFRELESKQRAFLPYHLKKLIMHFIYTENQAFPFQLDPPAILVRTGFSRNDFQQIFKMKKLRL